MGMWLFLFTELILFGGMFILYSVYRFKFPADFHLAAKELNTIVGTLNTAILLTSSLTMALSITAIQRRQKALSLFFQFIGIVLISVMMRFTSKGIVNSDSYVKLESTGLYWHLVDIIWIFLFPLFYLIT